jgi:hypothetical protein
VRGVGGGQAFGKGRGARGVLSTLWSPTGNILKVMVRGSRFASRCTVACLHDIYELCQSEQLFLPVGDALMTSVFELALLFPVLPSISRLLLSETFVRFYQTGDCVEHTLC